MSSPDSLIANLQKMATLAKQLGKKISQIRRQRGFTSERLAYENDISKGFLSDIENGKRLPSLKTLEKLTKALQIRMKDLFDF